MRHDEQKRGNVQRANVPTFHGILNIDKPAGWTSHDVVGKVRRLLGQKSVGHAGTLDPLATGVLLVCVGQATRLSEYLMAGQKVYRAEVRLGIETDTYDIEGETLAIAPVPALTTADIAAVLAQFVGDIEQVPPAYSALKQDGVPAYRRARRGESVALPPRRVTIADITLLAWEVPHLVIDVTCDPGTYIRSLAHDLGRTLGCGAALASLRRLRSGGFRVEDAVTLEELEATVKAGRDLRPLHPMAAALSALLPVTIDAEATVRLGHGQPIPCVAPPAQTEAYALTPDGDLVAILTYHEDAGQWWPKKVFAPEANQRIDESANGE